jgi:putative ABC transport system substrate-binding protein
MWGRAIGGIAALLLSLLILPCPSQAQRPATIPRIGFIHPTSAAAGSDILAAFRQGVRDFGSVESETITLEVRWAEGVADRLPALIADLLRLKVDVLVVAAAAGALAAKQAGLTIPVVFAAVTDPVGRGIIDTLARPDGNLTGTALALGEGFAGTGVEFLKEAVPQVARVAVLRNPTHPVAATFLRETQAAAHALGVTLQLVETRDHGELEDALVRLAQDEADALLVIPDPLFGFHRRRLVEFAARRRWPSMFFNREYAAAGGLMAYGPNFPASFRRAAYYVDRILKGAKPADLPVEQPTTFELVLNLTTAKALGITMSPSLLLLADEGIQ